MVIGELCGAPTLPARLEGPTFSEVAKQWTEGDLARDWPDHVNIKDNAPDERRIKTLAAIDVSREPSGTFRSRVSRSTT